MMKTVALVLALFLVTSCSAGGGAVAVPGKRLQSYWPEIGIDRYEAVVFPAIPTGP